MRITGGTLKGRRLEVPKNLKARPTTDFAREGIMNVIVNRYDIQNIALLDLFAGTGAISLEFLSRGAASSLAIDKQFHHTRYILHNARELKVNLKSYKGDVLKWLKSSPDYSFDMVFADPPYDLRELPKLPEMVFNSGVLKDGGVLILEHGKEHNFEDHPNFDYGKKYGHVNFSIFNKE